MPSRVARGGPVCAPARAEGAAGGVGTPRPAAVGPGGSPPHAALREVSQGFAALLWEEVLKAFQESMLPGMAGTPGGPLYAGLALQVLAREVAREAGLADFVYQALGGGKGEGAGLPVGRKSACSEYNRADRA